MKPATLQIGLLGAISRAGRSKRASIERGRNAVVLKLNDPRKLYEWETDRQLREGGEWIGCNHCGRTTRQDSIEHEYSVYHRYCFLKLFRREFAELMYGADVFANDPWERWLNRDRRATAI
jgi:hypothetical protein